MARASSIKNKKKQSGLLTVPESVHIFLARRLVDAIALSFAAIGAFLLLSLLSYTHTDPSWNTAAGQDGDIGHIQNLMGAPGAWSADLFMQTIGFGAYVIAVGFCIWGFHIFKRRPLKIFVLRVLALLFAGLFCALALAAIPSGDFLVHPYLGSTVGTMLMNSLGEILHGTNISWLNNIGHYTLSALSGGIFIALFLYACAFTRDEILHALSLALSTATGLAMFGLHLGRRFTHWLRHYNDPDMIDERPPLFEWPSWKLERKTAVKKAPVIDKPKMTPPKPVQEHPEAESSKDQHIPVVANTPPSEQPRGHTAASQQRFALNEEGEWSFPPLDLLEDVPKDAAQPQLNEEALRKNAELLQNVLNDFKIEGEIVSIHPGPVVTLYEFEPAPGIKSNKVISLADDIARSMAAISVRCAVVPGRNVIGIELPNKQRQFVYMREMLQSDHYTKTKAHLPLVLGKDIGGKPIMADLAKMPHLLVAGTTGSGKSVAVNTMILSLLYALPPEKCRFIMIDPKMLELSVYDDIPHLLSPVVTEPGKAVVALKWTVAEMEERYRAMSKLGVRNIEGYNERLAEARKKGETIMQKVQTGFDPETGEAVYENKEMDLTELPYIVVVVDEFADLMLVAGKDVENAIQRLAQMARAAGIHIIMATQRPSVDVITGVIKANFPTRISFQVTSKIDSRTILGDAGAEQLLGMGDMLYMAPGGRITRVHGPFVSDSNVEDVVNHLKAQGAPSYLTDITEGGDFGDSEIMNAIFEGRSDNGSGSDVDELYDQAVAIIAKEGKASTSFIQRHLQIGYNRAARIIEEMERQGIISKANATGKRDILVSDWSEV